VAPSTRDGLVKRSVTIQGHRTSLSLEPIFWEALRQAAADEGTPLNALVAEIDEARTTNLSSAIRVWLFERAQRGEGKAEAGNGFRRRDQAQQQL
jgi:predicted DNA-binding ribbon-helix-helix protein